MSDLIDPKELFQKLGEDPPPVVIDVRGKAAFEAGHIPGAKHIPGDEIGKRLAEIPKDRLVVPY
jgi:rhodanese-related sulfurtransferase